MDALHRAGVEVVDDPTEVGSRMGSVVAGLAPRASGDGAGS